MTKTVQRRGFFRSVILGMISARERQFQRYVNGSLLTLDDSTLHAHRYSREKLSKYPNAIYPL